MFPLLFENSEILCVWRQNSFTIFFREIALCSKRRFDESFQFSVLTVSNWRNFTFLETFRETDWFVNEFLQQIDYTKYFRSKSTIWNDELIFIRGDLHMKVEHLK